MYSWFVDVRIITPNNEKVEASQEKLENMTALYTGFLQKRMKQLIISRRLVYGPIMRMVQKNSLHRAGLSKSLSH